VLLLNHTTGDGAREELQVQSTNMVGLAIMAGTQVAGNINALIFF
jgi:hypothetical protein